jgi:membrane associated rhomboid family serine protease
VGYRLGYGHVLACGWGHILGNMWYLLIFGKNIENVFGKLG